MQVTSKIAKKSHVGKAVYCITGDRLNVLAVHDEILIVENTNKVRFSINKNDTDYDKTIEGISGSAPK